MLVGIDDSATFDVVGVGFGPSNLALAIAIEDHNRDSAAPERITSCFIEKQSRFGWHRGMLLPGTTMQISFLKDLVTQRDASSRYSFLNYLSERGRLHHFINQQTFFPTRIEFHDYLEWAAAHVDAPVLYGAQVSGVRQIGDVFEVSVSGRAPVLARNVVLAGGLRAKLPEGVTPSARVFHNHLLLDQLRVLPTPAHHRFVVVGAGQSAAEVAAYLHDSYPESEIHAVFGKYGYTPADDSPYANRIFDPEAVAEFHGASVELREQLMNYHRATNYSAVDLPLIEELYRREYAERVSGHRRLFVHGASEIADMVDYGDGVTVRIGHRTTQKHTEIDCDAIIYATGFRSVGLTELLGPLAGECEVDAQGRPQIDRDYRIVTSGRVAGGIYLQGDTEHTHGLTSTLLSNLAVRSGELTRSLSAGPRVGDMDMEGAPTLVGESV